MRSNTAYFLFFYFLFLRKEKKFTHKQNLLLVNNPDAKPQNFMISLASTPIQLEEQNKLQKNFISYIPTILPKLPLQKQ